MQASNKGDYLMIKVHCFQFQNKTWSNFLKWRLLMDQSCPRLQQLLRYACSIIQLFYIIGVYVCSFPLFLFSLFIYLFIYLFIWVIRIFLTGFLQLAHIFTDHLFFISIPELHPCNDVATFYLKLYVFLLREVNSVHYLD